MLEEENSDNTLIRSQLNWDPKYTLYQGLEKTTLYQGLEMENYYSQSRKKE